MYHLARIAHDYGVPGRDGNAVVCFARPAAESMQDQSSRACPGGSAVLLWAETRGDVGGRLTDPR